MTRDEHLSERDILAHLSGLTKRVDACERAHDSEMKGLAELQLQLGGLRERIDSVDLELHTWVLQIKGDFRKLVPAAGSASAMTKETSIVELETALDLVQREVAETRQSVKLQGLSRESQMELVEVVASLIKAFKELERKVSNLQGTVCGPLGKLEQPDWVWALEAVVVRLGKLEQAQERLEQEHLAEDVPSEPPSEPVPEGLNTLEQARERPPQSNLVQSARSVAHGTSLQSSRQGRYDSIHNQPEKRQPWNMSLSSKPKPTQV